jgi:hypothetical protein
LADLEAKKAALEGVISSWRKALELGAFGPLRFPRVEGASPPTGVLASSPEPVDLPVGALSSKSIPDAIKFYLAAVRKKQTNKEIEEGLRQHGVESTSKKFSSIVAGALFRLKKSGEVLRFSDGWGLAEHYPEHLRAKLSQGNDSVQKTKPRKRRKGRQRKGTVPDSTPGQIEGPKPTDRILAVLRNQPGIELSLHEISDFVKIRSRVVNAVLTNLTKSKTIQKTGSGKYRIAA